MQLWWVAVVAATPADTLAGPLTATLAVQHILALELFGASAACHTTASLRHALPPPLRQLCDPHTRSTTLQEQYANTTVTVSL